MVFVYVLLLDCAPLGHQFATPGLWFPQDTDCWGQTKMEARHITSLPVQALDGGAVALTVRPHAEGFPGAAASMGGAVAAATGRPPLPHGPVLPPPGTYSHGGASARRQRSARGAGLASVGGGAPPSLARTSVESNSSGGEDPKKPLLGLGGSSSDPAPL